jgi:hypothetical protein
MYISHKMHCIVHCCLVHRIIVVVVVVAQVAGSLEPALEEVNLLLLVVLSEGRRVLATLSGRRDGVG